MPEVVDVTKLRPEEMLPHRGDRLMVSAFRAYQPGYLLATYNVPLMPSWLGLHFPEPIGPFMPGHDIAEALAQVAGVLGRLDFPELDGKMGLLRGTAVKYGAQVVPGDCLYLCVEKPSLRHGLLEATVVAFNGDPAIDGRPACKGTITLAVVDMPTVDLLPAA